VRTFKQLQDDTLAWMADQSDTGLMRTLVKSAINEHHQQLLHEDRYDFMLWPRSETLSVVSGTSVYALHPQFDQPLYLYNATAKEYLEEVPAKSLLESGAEWATDTPTKPDRYMFAGIAKVQQQPAAAATVTVATTGGTEAAANGILVSGITGAGTYLEETLSSTNPWSTLTSTNTFQIILDITKIGASWSRTITVSCDSQTLLTLNASEFGKQFRMLEILGTPQANLDLLYRFYRKPRQLVNDNDIPDLPETFDEILVLRALIALQGYSRATSDEQVHWRGRLTTLEQSLKMTYQQSRSLGGRPTFTRYIPRG
jgi:hypothetical protein